MKSLGRRTARVASWLAALGAAIQAAACGGSDTNTERSVSFVRDVEPLFLSEPWNGPTFGGRCASCHHAGSVTGLDLTSPFDPSRGLVGVLSDWKGSAGILRVAPGDVARSFLVDKISRTDLARETEGFPMPPAIPRLSPSEVQTVVQWISDGARNDAFFAASVAPIFGDAKTKETAGRCSVCHYPGSPTNLDLSSAFDAEVGLVGVPTQWGRAGGFRVVAGDPSASFLIDKIEREDLDLVADGQPMPLELPRLNAEQAQTIRVWIREGAHSD
jgi:hypothetical protein